jgi:transcriptional regulator with XRE-family HTH domain
MIMASFEKEPPLTAAALRLNLEILHNIIMEELHTIKEENERLRFELAALHAVTGTVTAFTRQTRRTEMIPLSSAREVFLHHNIRILRSRCGMTREQMADLYGIPKDIWITYEGKRIPSADLLIAISKSFGVSVDDLLHKDLSAFDPPTPDAAKEIYFHKNLRHLRSDQHLSSEEIAQVLDVTCNSWKAYENDLLPERDVVERIARNFGLTADDLLYIDLATARNYTSFRMFQRSVMNKPLLDESHKIRMSRR